MQNHHFLASLTYFSLGVLLIALGMPGPAFSADSREIGSSPMASPAEAANLAAQSALEAASRARALALQRDPGENSAPVSHSLQPSASTSAVRADLTVGSGCSFGTIGNAIAAASAGDRLLIEGGVTFTENITIPINLVLQGGYNGCASNSTTPTTIDGNAGGSVIAIDSALEVTLQNLDVTNGSTSLEGGGIRFARGDGTGTLTLSNIRIFANAAMWGGGLWVGPNAVASGENVQIFDNNASLLGGGLRLYGSRATFSDSNIHGNSSPVGAGVMATRETGFSPQLNLPSNTDIHGNNALSADGFGGGVYMREGTISLAGCSDIYGNHAIEGGGVYMLTSTLALAGDCGDISLNTATGNGGGVYAMGSVINLDDGAMLYNNSAETGGGAYMDDSSLWGDQALILYNTAELRGGGVYATNGSVFDMDLGPYPCPGTRCSQLSYNTANTFFGGGVYAGANSTIDLRNTFVESNSADYGGGIYAYDNATVHLYNSLLAGNDAFSGTGDAIRLNGTTLNGAGNTLAYNNTGGAATGQAIGLSMSTLSLHCSILWGHASSINDTGQDVTYSNIEGGYAGTGNLNINPAFVNSAGGDFHLQAGSPVIDRCPRFNDMDTDFDNEPRPVVHTNATTPYDMGADEFSTPRVGINGGSCAYGTLSQAVAAAGSDDTIQMVADLFTETVDITDKNLTIVGGFESNCTTPGGGVTALDGAYDSGSTIDIRGSTVILRNLLITGGDSIGGGVDADSGAVVTLDNVDINGNTGAYGAGLYVGPSANVTMINGSRIRNNVASIAGGGARVWGSLKLADWNSVISNNHAPDGGGVSVPGGSLELDPGHVSVNQATGATGKGGGIQVLDGGMVMLADSSNVSFNTAHDGAGIHADDSTVVFLTAFIHKNTASNNGGGIALVNGSHLDSIFAHVGNTSASDLGNQAAQGAGIYLAFSSMDFTGNISNNLATGQGGGVFADAGTINLSNARIGGTQSNQPNQLGPNGHLGAGLYLSNGTQATIQESQIAANSFQTTGFTYGGGLYLIGSSSAILIDSIIEHHTAPSTSDGRGAGIYISASDLVLDGSDVISNTAGTAGGGIRIYNGGSLDVINGSLIQDNHALNGPGGGIASQGAVTMEMQDVSIFGNSASLDGGGIYISDGTLNIQAFLLYQNTANGNGGGVAVVGAASVDFRATGYSMAYFNRALNGNGGMVYLGNNTTTRLYATTGAEMWIYANRAVGNGGALYANGGGLFDIYGKVLMESNLADDNGGGVYLTNGSRVWLDDYVNIRPRLIKNRALSGSGGAIHAVNSPRVECDGAIFGAADDGNQATEDGGAVYLANSAFKADNCIFRDNIASASGGAIAAIDSEVEIFASFASAIMSTPETVERASTGASTRATGCNPDAGPCSALFANQAQADGGAIFSNGSNMTVNHTIFHSNAAQRGGGILQAGASAAAEVNNSLFHDNVVALSFGAGIRRDNGDFDLQHVTLSNNIGGSGFSGQATEARNSIAWGNDGFPGFSISPTLAECNIDDGGHAGPILDPLFIDPGQGANYRLSAGSPAINACASGLSPDLDNIPRPFGSDFDMGAYESHEDGIFRDRFEFTN